MLTDIGLHVGRPWQAFSVRVVVRKGGCGGQAARGWRETGWHWDMLQLGFHVSFKVHHLFDHWKSKDKDQLILPTANKSNLKFVNMAVRAFYHAYTKPFHCVDITKYSWKGRKIIIQLKTMWVATWQNQQNTMCAQRRLRSAWASAQSDQSLHCALNG